MTYIFIKKNIHYLAWDSAVFPHFSTNISEDRQFSLHDHIAFWVANFLAFLLQHFHIFLYLAKHYHITIIIFHFSSINKRVWFFNCIMTNKIEQNIGFGVFLFAIMCIFDKNVKLCFKISTIFGHIAFKAQKSCFFLKEFAIVIIVSYRQWGIVRPDTYKFWSGVADHVRRKNSLQFESAGMFSMCNSHYNSSIDASFDHPTSETMFVHGNTANMLISNGLLLNFNIACLYHRMASYNIIKYEGVKGK